MNNWRTAGRGRGPVAAALAVTMIITAACGSSLKDDDPADSQLAGVSLDAWPELDLVGSATSPVLPDVTVAVQPVVRTPDGLATLTLEIDNGGNDELETDDVFSYNGDFIPAVRIYDPADNVRYFPVSAEDEDQAGYCVCSSSTVTIPAGEVRTVYVTYSDLPEDVETVWVQMNGFTPIDDVPVEHADAFDVHDEGVTAPMESDQDLQVAIDSVTRHPEGTLVSARYINEGRSEPVDLEEFPEPSGLTVMSADGDAAFLALSDGDEVFSATDLAETDEPIARGESFRVEVLTAPLPDGVDSVFVRGNGGMRRTLPVQVEDSDEPVDPQTFTIPRNLEDPVIHTLSGPSDRFGSPIVPTSEPNLPPVDELGPEMPEIEVTDTLTSEAQPDFSISVRGVVRGPGDFSTVLLDVSRGDVFPDWPEGVGVDGSARNLGDITVLDHSEERSYGVYTVDSAAWSASDSWSPGRDETVPAYALIPALEPTTSEVDVDVPAFGTVEDVPVVDWPSDPASGGVAASMRVRGNDNLRMDILTISHLGNGNGTLVRARLVNESDPDSVEAPFANEGSNNLCSISLMDPATGSNYNSLQGPCLTTTWSTNLAQGEELVYEVRFPELPDNIGDVVVSSSGYFPSGPVTVTEGESPWYLAFPANADDPEGATYGAAVGVVDRSATVTEVDDMVEVVLEGEVFFDFDSDGLTDEGEELITDLAEQIGDTARPGTVTITGHTDEIGSDDYNDGLSEDRADAVRAVLEEAIDRSDLDFEVEGRGSRDPVAPNEIDGRDNPDGRERNRRVEIVYEAQ